MNMEQLMNRKVQVCRAEDTAKQVAQLMWDHDIGCLPVVDDRRRPIAMVTDRDLLMAAHLAGKGLDQLRIFEAMSKQIHVVRHTDSIQTATELMRTKQIRRVPVVDATGTLVGIVSLNDLALAGRTNGEIKPEQVANTLASICQPRPQQAQARM